MRACSSGVSFGSSRSGSSDGSPTGSEPSGSSRAREVAVRAVRLDERHRRGDAAEQLRVDGRRLRRLEHRDRCLGGVGLGPRVADVVGPVPRKTLEQPREPGMGREQFGVAALEERAPLGRHALRVLEVVVEQRACVAGVQAVDVVRAHPGVVPTLPRMSFPPTRVSPISRAGGA